MGNGLIGLTGLIAQLLAVVEQNTEIGYVIILHLSIMVNHAVVILKKFFNAERSLALVRNI